MSAFVTYHSISRAKDRQNVKNQRAAERHIVNAIEKGKRAEDLTSWERDFLLNQARDGCVAVAYNRYCYIVNSENVCVTLYPLPAWFGKKKHFDGKERIRNFKRYQNYSWSNIEENCFGDEMDDDRNQKEVIAGYAGFEGAEQGVGYMSRDWTPREAYLVEQHGLKNGGLSVFDSMRSTVVCFNGQTWRRYSDEEMSIREQFPVLGKFLGPFMELYGRISKYDNGIEFLKLQDLELQEYIATGNYNQNSYLPHWFEGNLVNNFHYSEQNDALLVECVCEEAMLHAGKQYDAYMEYRLDWYSDHGIREEDIAQVKAEYLEDVEKGRFNGTFHQYELEFGYHDGTLFYDGFDAFWERHFGEQAKEVGELNPDVVGLMETKRILTKGFVVPDDIGFQFNGQWIQNPFFDETLRFEVSTFEYYGQENVEHFLDALLRVASNEDKLLSVDEVLNRAAECCIERNSVVSRELDFEKE